MMTNGDSFAAEPSLADAKRRATEELEKKYGAAEKQRIERGVQQVAAAWRPSDGGAEALRSFLVLQFVPSGGPLGGVVTRFQEALEALDGHFLEISRELGRHTTLDLGPVTELDKLFAAFDAGAHLLDDLFASKIAMVVLANLPLTTLAERLAQGDHWSREKWAQARLAGRFERRIPAEVQQQIAAASSNAELYIAEYNLWMHHVVGAGNQRLFPKGLKLISHWNLRDELKAQYANKDGLARQRAIAKLMERIVDQSIPKVAINNPAVDWDPVSNQIAAAPPTEIEQSAPLAAAPASEREPDTRYQMLLATYHAARLADPFSPKEPTMIARRFDVDREIPEARFVKMMEEILTSPLVPKVARLIEQRLSRKLEPFDIWYDGFRPRAKYSEAELDARVRKRYPTAAAYQADIERLLIKLGFRPERAQFFAQHIVVDPARGAGHALEAQRRGDNPHLRTRIEPGGMNYKGFNIAVHEMGHNVEQICSLYLVDNTLLRGVPNTAFTEALAFVFQARDLELLDLGKPDAESERLRALNDLWATFEIAGVSLVDLGVWHWMYAHPQATPAELRAATVQVAREVWNKYYAPVFGTKDVLLLGIYSHMISSFLYLPDYPLGHLIAAQIEEHLRKAGQLGDEFERMAKYGAVTPDLWMKNATGAPVSTAPLLRMAAAALALTTH
jgi:hypothetical protein